MTGGAEHPELYEWQVRSALRQVLPSEATRIIFDATTCVESWLGHFSLAMLLYQRYARPSVEAAHAAVFLATALLSDQSARIRDYIILADNYAVADVARDMLRHFDHQLPRFTFVDQLYFLAGKEVHFSAPMLHDILHAICARATSERAITAALLLKWR